jgi:hypothetical protein
MQYSLVFLPGLLVGRLFDLGWFRLPFAMGSVSLVLSAFLIAQCTEYWHFIICQGLMVGVSPNPTHIFSAMLISYRYHVGCALDPLSDWLGIGLKRGEALRWLSRRLGLRWVEQFSPW